MRVKTPGLRIGHAIRCSLVALAFAAVLAACGGGGGGGSTAETVTVTCPDGTTQETATSTVLALSLCPQPKVLSVAPADGATGVAVDTTVRVALDSAIDAASIVASVTVDGKSVTVKLTLADAKSVTVALAAPLQPEKAVVYSVTGKDTGGRTFAANGTFTTAAAWWSTVTVYTTTVEGWQQIAAGCNHWADQCAHDAVKSGVIKVVAIPVTIGGRPVGMAYFKNSSTFVLPTGSWERLPIYLDDFTLVGNDMGGGKGAEIDWVKPSSNGLYAHLKDGDFCNELFLNASNAFSERSATCPSK